MMTPSSVQWVKSTCASRPGGCSWLKVHLPIRPMKGSVVSDPALQRPQLGPAEPARVSLVKPLQDGCRTQLTVGTGPQQRHDIALPHLRERVRSASPSPPGLLTLRRQRSPLPLPCRSLAHGGCRRRCLLCLAFHQLLPQYNYLLIRDQCGTSRVPDHPYLRTGKNRCRHRQE